MFYSLESHIEYFSQTDGMIRGKVEFVTDSMMSIHSTRPYPMMLPRDEQSSFLPFIRKAIHIKFMLLKNYLDPYLMN